MINKAQLLGRIGKKDYKQTKNGNVLCTLSIATTRKYNDSMGVTQEQTTWHNVNFFNKLADIANSYAHVGDLIYVEGEINNKKIEDEHGNTKYAYSITGSELKLLPNNHKTAKQDKQEQASVKDELFDDGIPF